MSSAQGDTSSSSSASAGEQRGGVEGKGRDLATGSWSTASSRDSQGSGVAEERKDFLALMKERLSGGVSGL